MLLLECQKYNFWKVEHVKLFLSKTQFKFWCAILSKQKNNFVPFTNVSSSMFAKKNQQKKLLNNLAKFMLISSQEKTAQSQKNNIRAKAGWISSYLF